LIATVIVFVLAPPQADNIDKMREQGHGAAYMLSVHAGAAAFIAFVIAGAVFLVKRLARRVKHAT
jgi:hypothetical protein